MLGNRALFKNQRKAAAIVPIIVKAAGGLTIFSFCSYTSLQAAWTNTLLSDAKTYLDSSCPFSRQIFCSARFFPACV
jgi:hypothetical protein